MIETLIIILCFLWYFLALIVSEQMGKKTSLGTEWLFFISMAATPLAGFILALALRKRST
ncbi:MAG: hypothetical protein JXA03_12795 [Bacteroidales bacterium]|nr:hypothetical protein [Bacteroidales bacterium]